MNIGLKKAQSLVDRYYAGKLPATETAKADGTGRAEYFQDVFQSLPKDDNGPLDGNPNRGVVEYVGGDQIGFSYVYDDKGMIGGGEHNGRGIYDEFEFSGDTVTQLSGKFNLADGKGSLSATTYDLANKTTEEQRWNAFDDSQGQNSVDAVQLEAAPPVIGVDLFAPMTLNLDGLSEEAASEKKQKLKKLLARLGI